MNSLLSLFNLHFYTQGSGVNRWISLHNSNHVELQLDNYSYKIVDGEVTEGLSSPRWAYKSGMFVYLEYSARFGRSNVHYIEGDKVKTRFSEEIDSALANEVRTTE